MFPSVLSKIILKLYLLYFRTNCSMRSYRNLPIFVKFRISFSKFYSLHSGGGIIEIEQKL